MSETQPVTEDGGAAAPPPEVSPETEARARNMGWTPREQYRGPADQYLPADEFITKAERMLPLLQERNRSLDRTVENLRGEMGKQQQMLGDLVHRTRRAEKVGYDRAMRELQQKRAVAVSQGDTETFNQVEAEIQQMGPAPEPEPPPRPPAAPPQGQEVNPVVTAWVRRNAWFNRDPVANATAVATLSQVEREYPGDSLEEHLVEVEKRISQIYPHHFQRSGSNGAARAPAVMASGAAPAPRTPGPKSFEAIPAEHRKDFERQKRMLEGKGEPFSKEEFARYYWEAEGE